MLTTAGKALFQLVVKDLIMGVLLKGAKEVALKYVQKTPWVVIFERLLTRVMVVCLKYLTTLTTNTIMLETVNDLLFILQSKGLTQSIPIRDTQFVTDAVSRKTWTSRMPDNVSNDEFDAVMLSTAQKLFSDKKESSKANKV